MFWCFFFFFVLLKIQLETDTKKDKWQAKKGDQKITVTIKHTLARVSNISLTNLYKHVIIMNIVNCYIIVKRICNFHFVPA